MQEISSLRKIVAEKCAATLLGYKPASLFSLNRAKWADFDSLYPIIRNELLPFLSIRCLKKDSDSFLILVYRVEALAELLSASEVRNFLACYGYPKECLDICSKYYSCNENCSDCEQKAVFKQVELLINNIVYKLKSNKFPHEIGVFLGYPLCDVEAFIRCSGKEEKCIGPWKVYGDVEKAKERFELFAQAKQMISDFYIADNSLATILLRPELSTLSKISNVKNKD